MRNMISRWSARISAPAAWTGLLAALGLIWLRAGSATGSPVALLSRAAEYELFLWALTAGVTLWVYAAVSLAEFWELLGAALVTSAPVLWLPPGLLLMSLRDPAATAIALILIANAARLLATHKAPRLESPGRGSQVESTSAVQPLFQYACGRPVREQAFLTTAGAVGFHVGMCAVWAERPLAACALFAAGAALWTLASNARREPELRAAPVLRHLLLGIAVTAVLLAESRLVLSRAQAGAAPQSGWLAEARSVLKAGARPAPTPAPPARSAPGAWKEIGRVGRDGYPGVVLVPPPLQPGKGSSFFPARIGRGFGAQRPLTIPFTGEYHLFPSLYDFLPEGFIIYRGTPLEGIYATVGGGPLETQAYQRLDPPIDFANCGEVRMRISSGESTPAVAGMQLALSTGFADLGTQFFAMNPSAEEILAFSTPRSGDLKARGIHVVFQRDPQHRERNAKVAIKDFTLIPRGS